MNSIKVFKLTELKQHPWQNNIPNIEGKDWAEFLADIKERGVQEPLRVSLRTGEPVIVDGHQRVRAAQEIGFESLEAITQDFADEGEEVTFLAGSARFRRRLTDHQRVVIAEAYEAFFRPQAEEVKREAGKEFHKGKSKVDSNLNQPLEVSNRALKSHARAAEISGLSVGQYHKGKVIEHSNLEPVKEAWREEAISTHAAHMAVRAPDPIREAMSARKISVDDGIAIAKNKVLSRDVVEGRKTPGEAASVIQQMKQALKAQRDELDFDITSHVWAVLDKVVQTELSEYHRAVYSKQNARTGGEIQIMLEDALNHLKAAWQAVHIVDSPESEKTITLAPV